MLEALRAARKQSSFNHQEIVKPLSVDKGEEGRDLISEALKAAMRETNNKKPKGVSPSNIDHDNDPRVPEEQQGILRVARILNQNARLFAENMAELISLKLE